MCILQARQDSCGFLQTGLQLQSALERLPLPPTLPHQTRRALLLHAYASLRSSGTAMVTLKKLHLVATLLGLTGLSRSSVTISL